MNEWINKLDKDGLARLGIAFKDRETSREFEALISEELEVRIGSEISKGMSEELLEEFDLHLLQNDTVDWLNRYCPDYQEIVAAVSAELKGELLQNKHRIKGLRFTSELKVNGIKLEELDMSILTRIRLKQAGISTFGEMSAIRDLSKIDLLKQENAAEITRLIRSAKKDGFKSVLKNNGMFLK